MGNRGWQWRHYLWGVEVKSWGKKISAKKETYLKQSKIPWRYNGEKSLVQIKKKYLVKNFKQEEFKLSVKSYSLTLSNAV